MDDVVPPQWGNLIVRSTSFIAAIMSMWSVALWGQTTSDSSRAALQKDYLQMQQNNPSPFGSTPITHISLQRKALTTGLTSDVFNATIVPENEDISQSRSGQKVRMDVGGWDSSVLLAFSAAEFGVGILGRGGERQAHYLNQSTLSSQPSSGQMEDFGAASYGGGQLQSNVTRMFNVNIVD